jgi:predicted ATPase with chaperone activity
VARTIADLGASDRVREAHIKAALTLRQIDVLDAAAAA